MTGDAEPRQTATHIAQTLLKAAGIVAAGRLLALLALSSALSTSPMPLWMGAAGLAAGIGIALLSAILFATNEVLTGTALALATIGFMELISGVHFHRFSIDAAGRTSPTTVDYSPVAFMAIGAVIGALVVGLAARRMMRRASHGHRVAEAIAEVAIVFCLAKLAAQGLFRAGLLRHDLTILAVWAPLAAGLMAGLMCAAFFARRPLLLSVILAEVVSVGGWLVWARWMTGHQAAWHGQVPYHGADIRFMIEIAASTAVGAVIGRFAWLLIARPSGGAPAASDRTTTEEATQL